LRRGDGNGRTSGDIGFLFAHDTSVCSGGYQRAYEALPRFCLALSKERKAGSSAFSVALFGKASDFRLEPFQPAYAVHRGDACQLSFFGKLAEFLSCHVLKIGQSCGKWAWEEPWCCSLWRGARAFRKQWLTDQANRRPPGTAVASETGDNAAER
jgi:hypothetical protein